MSVITTAATRTHRSRHASLQTALTLLVTLLLSLGIAGCENVSIGNGLPALSDEAPLSLAVSDALSRDPEVGRLGIKVKSLDGDTVRLSGNVESDAQKTTAENVALRVDGVRTVVNTLFVRY